MPERDTVSSTMVARVAGLVRAIEPGRLPSDVVDQAELALLHNLTVALAGRSERQYYPSTRCHVSGPGTATRLVDGQKTVAEVAVRDNAALMGSRAQHDIHHGSSSHFGTCIISGLLAIAEQQLVSGTRFLAAMAAGYEAGAAIGNRTATETTRRGFRATGLYGAFAAAAACCHLWDLPAAVTGNALALAANMAAGTNQMWLRGTEEWRLHPSMAAHNGYLAALLAREGIETAPDALEGTAGFYAAYNSAPPTPEQVFAVPEVPTWAVRDVDMKPYPVCAINQAPVQLTAGLVAGLGGAAVDRVREITVSLNPRHADYPGTDNPTPHGRSAALMSVQFCLALIALRGSVSPADLDEWDDPVLLDLASRVRIKRDREVEPSFSVIELELTDGTTLSSGDPVAVTYTTEDARVLGALLAPAAGVEPGAMSHLADVVLGLHTQPDAACVIRACLPQQGGAE